MKLKKYIFTFLIFIKIVYLSSFAQASHIEEIENYFATREYFSKQMCYPIFNYNYGYKNKERKTNKKYLDIKLPTNMISSGSFDLYPDPDKISFIKHYKIVLHRIKSQSHDQSYSLDSNSTEQIFVDYLVV